jgi:hypothetical protein
VSRRDRARARALAGLLVAAWAGAASAQAAPGAASSTTAVDRARAAEEDAMFGAARAAEEDAMFGAAPVATSTGATSAVGGAAPLGGSTAVGDAGEADALLGTTAQATIDARMRDAYDKLTIGGFLWLLGSAALTPDATAGTGELSSPSFADVYLDVRPVDRIRGYVRGRLRFDVTQRDGDYTAFGTPVQPVSVLLDQAWIKTDIAETVFLTLGREKIRWGATRFFLPTDFVNTTRLDAVGGVLLFDQRVGVGVVKAHLPIESLGWNFYAIAGIEGARRPDEVAALARAEFLLGETELALSFGARKGNATRLGLSLSSGLSIFELRFDAALEHALPGNFVRGQCDVASGQLGEVYSRADEWVPRVAGGIETSIALGDDDTLILGGEYFYNHAGYGDDAIYPCLLQPNVNGFTPFLLGKHYTGLYAVVDRPLRFENVTLTASALANLSDQSGLARFDYRVRVLSFLSVNAWVAGYFGATGSEFRFGYKQAGNTTLAAAIGNADLLATLPPEQLGLLFPGVDPAQLAQLSAQLQGARDLPAAQRAQLAELTRRGLDISPRTFELGVGARVDF